MAVFPKGREALASMSSGGRGRFARSLYWKDGDEKIIQFVTSIDEVPRFQHYSLKVGVRNTGSADMQDFIDPRPYLGDDAYNPIASREWTAGPVNPLPKAAAVAVELDEDKKHNLSVATHEYENSKGEDVEAPNVGILIQSKTFWSWFESYADRKGTDLLGEAFVVERVKGSQPVKYNVVPLGAGVELDTDVTDAIDLDDYLESLMSEERFKELIDPLGDDWVLNHYAQKKGKDSKAKTKPAARSRAAKAVEDDESDEGADETVDRKAAFDGLKAALKG